MAQEAGDAIKMNTQQVDENEMQCPRCNGKCRRDEVHNGLAWLYGPWGCFDCGWSE